MKFRSNKINNAKSGFTMIELMLVIVIGVGLGALAIPRFMDTKNMNDAREEANKLSELKSNIDSMFQRSIDYSGMESRLALIAPSSFERTGNDSQLLSIWKQPLTISNATNQGEYSITYDNVPAGRVCQEFLRGTHTQGWDTITMTDGGSADGAAADYSPLDLVAMCESTQSGATATVGVTFNFAI